jgi:PAS domain S-box-containing protein
MTDLAHPVSLPTEPAWVSEPLSVLIRAEQVAMVYRLTPYNLAISTVVAFFGWLLAWLVGAGVPIAIWLACTSLIIVARYHLVRRYHRAAPRPSQSGVWSRRFIVGAFVMGAAWGVGGIMLYELGDDSTRMFLAFILAGVAAAGAGSLSALPRAYPAYLLPAILPFTAYLFHEGEPVCIAMGIAALGFVGLVLGVSARWTRSIEETLTLRFENLALLSSLSQSKSGLERSNMRLRHEVAVRSRAESLARAEAEKLAMYVAQAPLAIIETDLQYRILAWNPAAEALFGRPRGEVLGKSVIDLVFPVEAHNAGREFAAKLLAGRKSDTGLLRTTAHDGRTIVTEWHVSPLCDNLGAVIGFAAAVREVTERYDLGRLKNEFIASLGRALHEPLAALRGVLGKLAESEELSGSALTLAHGAYENCERLVGMVQSATKVDCREPRLADGELLPLDLGALVRRVVGAAQALASHHEVNVTLAEPQPHALVAGDDARLGKVFSDLLDNAIRQTPEGGNIQVSLNVDEARVRLSITDYSGNALDAAHSHMIHPLSRGEVELSSHEGGLLFRATRQAIEKLDGKLSFESYHNAGTTFHVELPRWLPVAA